MEPTYKSQPSVTANKPRNSFKAWTVVFALLFICAGVFAVWQTSQVNQLNVDERLASLQAEKLSLQNELAKLKGTDAPASEQEQASPDSTKILAAVDAHVRAPVAAAGTQYEYAIDKTEGNFAEVNVSVPEGGGFNVWLKKVGDNWTVILSGQDTPPQADQDKYGIPATFF